ncbi:MAG: ABC transporter substrate-binding protein, partial [Pseudonocardiaceae bacterium]
SQGQWKPVVDQLGGMTNQNNPLVAVVGMGVSLVQTQQAAGELSRRKIPMVGSIITADGLDYNHIQGLIRVSPSNEDYVRSLRIYLGGRSDVHTGVLVYDSNSDSGVDIFTKTLRDDFEHEMRDLIGNSAPLSFTGVSIPTDANPGMFAPLRANICSVKPDVIFYAGRQLDLAGFLQSLENRICRNLPLTVMTGGTNLAALVRSQVEQLRAAKLTVVFSGTTDAQGWANNVPGTPDGYQGFLSAFTGQKLDPAHLDDGGAIMTHDAVLTAAEAVQLAAPGGRIPVAEDVRNQLMNLNGEYRVPGASGTLSFSFRERGAGNPEGKVVPIFQFPRPPGHPSGQIGSLYHTP